MTQAIFTRPVNRLASRVGSKGLSRPFAIKQADANLDSIRSDILAYIDRNIDELDAIFSQCEDRADPALAGLYEPANAVGGTAGTVGLVPLGRAAHSLCQLLANGEESGIYSLPAIKLHLDGIRLLRRFTYPEQNTDAVLILESLAKLIASVAS